MVIQRQNSISPLNLAHSKSYTTTELKHSEQTANIGTQSRNKYQSMKAKHQIPLTCAILKINCIFSESKKVEIRRFAFLRQH